MDELSSINKTLLIPLYGKASMSKDNIIISDKKAEEIIESVNYDFSKLRVSKKTQIILSLKAAMIDDYINEFIERNPGCIILNLGCGLDSRVLRISNKAKCWYDVDFSNVIDLKKRYFSENEHYKMIGASVTERSWMDQIEYAGEPVLIIAEDLLMYLNEIEVRRLIIALKNKFYYAEMIFDVFSKAAVKLLSFQSLLRNTRAKVKWGIDNPSEIEGNGIKHIDTKYLNNDKRIQQLEQQYKDMFNKTKNMNFVRESQRIFVFILYNQ